MKPRPCRVVIVAAQFNRAIAEPMIEAAQSEAVKLATKINRVVRVSGTYEIPLALDAVLSARDVDAAVVLGYIETGETLHGEVMGHVVHKAFIDLSLAHGKPVGIGIVGPGATLAQAQLRKKEYARAAVRAAISAVETLRKKR